MEITASIITRKATPFPTMQTAVAVLRVHRQSGTPPILLFPQRDRHAQDIPFKVGALQAAPQRHLISRAEPTPLIQAEPCMRFGNLTNIQCRIMPTAAAALLQAKLKRMVSILHCPRQRQQEVGTPLRAGGLQVLQQPLLISRVELTQATQAEHFMLFGRVTRQRPIP